MLLRQTNQSLFPRPLYQYRPEILDPYRYNPGVQMRRAAQLGLVPSPNAASSLISSFTDFFGGLLHVKSPEQTAFDNARQQLWEEYVSLLNRANPSLAPQVPQTIATYDQMSGWVNELRGIMQKNGQIRDAAISQGVDAAWVAPRYADYENAFEGTLAAWTPILQSLKPFGIVDTITNFFTGGSVAPRPDTFIPADAGLFPATVTSSTNGLLMAGVIVGGLLLFAKTSRKS